jgi:hypothetical protein
MADTVAERRRPRLKLRAWLRALHRDTGYFVVGLTIIYAVSGLAVNHIADWDPSFSQIKRIHPLRATLPKNADAAAKRVLSELRIVEAPREVFRASDSQLEIVLDKRTLHVDEAKREILEEGQEPRFFLRLANWLHLNRGKKAWSYIADGYAVLLLFLALSGLFMIGGRKGLLGRGAVIAVVGASLPVLYVVLSGGP